MPSSRLRGSIERTYNQYRNKNIAYYENIRNLPNVHFVDHKLPGVQLASECEAVITVSGTIGIEATLLGKRVLTFAKRSEYRFLPNVIFVRALTI